MGSPVDGEGSTRYCGEQQRAHEGCPFRLDIIEDTTKAALSDGGTTTTGSCLDVKTAAMAQGGG